MKNYDIKISFFGKCLNPFDRDCSTSIIVEIPQAIERIEQVYSIDKNCVDAVMSLIGTTAVTQGPQGTSVSSVVMEDERRILKCLRDIKDLLNRFNPSQWQSKNG